MTRSLLFIGSVMADIVCPLDFFPEPGQGVVAEGTTQAVGGCAFNAANIARQLGADCSLFVPLGNGPYATFLSQQLDACGFSGLQVDTDLDCGAALCLVQPNGERTMITLPGIEREFEDSWFGSLDGSSFDAAYVCGYELDGQGGASILNFLENNPHLQVYYAPGPVICKIDSQKTDRINALKPVWHLNDQEAVAFTGCASVEEAGVELVRRCQNVVIITEGAKGSHVFNKGDYALVPTIPIKPIDTIGAGDSNIGSFMAARSKGYGILEAAALANKVSAAVCQVSGATYKDAEFEKTGIVL